MLPPGDSRVGDRPSPLGGRAGPAGKRLRAVFPRPARFFDNRGHEKRAGPSAGEHCVSPVFAARADREVLRKARGSINADSEQRIQVWVHVYESYSSDL